MWQYKLTEMSRNRKQKRNKNFRSLRAEIKRVWQMKRIIIPEITGATRIVTKNVKKHLEAKPGRHSIDLL
jgi:hypothetical protein